jgi:hypothetical protein
VAFGLPLQRYKWLAWLEANCSQRKLHPFQLAVNLRQAEVRHRMLAEAMGDLQQQHWSAVHNRLFRRA